MWTVAKTRPISVVYAAGGYTTINALGYENAHLKIDQIKVLQQRWPVWLAVNLPPGTDKGIQDIWAMMGEGLQFNVENYVPYEQKIPSLEKEGLQADGVKEASPGMRTYQSKHPEQRFFPITTSLYGGYVAVDIKTGKVLDFFKSE